ncbi:unnamed protein product [Eruca vesicaria subsp. sativa]|uniref:Uncharacterized protein n=1 Tax=Eruca vesicaria subsp. sativa TaxID=29727 RepID=A0ABC8LHV8_ERUVS|nr:unnamed protein product [Eruca vesicaria subsp. sativa]
MACDLLLASKYLITSLASWMCNMFILMLRFIPALASTQLLCLIYMSATIGSQTDYLGGEVGFDTASSSLTKYNAEIGFNKADFSVALVLGEYTSYLRPHGESNHIRWCIFSIGSSYSLDPFTTVKARLSNNGKAGMVVQSEWRPKSLITLSAEYDSKAVTSLPRLGLALSLKP